MVPRVESTRGMPIEAGTIPAMHPFCIAPAVVDPEGSGTCMVRWAFPERIRSTPYARRTDYDQSIVVVRRTVNSTDRQPNFGRWSSGRRLVPWVHVTEVRILPVPLPPSKGMKTTCAGSPVRRGRQLSTLEAPVRIRVGACRRFLPGGPAWCGSSAVTRIVRGSSPRPGVRGSPPSRLALQSLGSRSPRWRGTPAFRVGGRGFDSPREHVADIA